MTQLEQGSEQSLAKILDRSQYSLLKQIQLQLAGIPGLLQPDMVEKLNLNEDQVAQIQNLLAESGRARMENGRARFDMMKQAFPDAFNPNNGQNGGPPNGGGQDPNGQNGGGQNGNGNGRGGRNRPNFRDPAFREAMQKFMDQPDTKAKMEEIRAQDEKLQNQLTAAVNRVLTKRQAAAYKKMLGATFDLSKIWGGPGQGPGNRGRNGNPANASNAAGKTQASGAGNGGDAATAKPAAKGNSSSTAKAKRKSLREQRGLD
jgi:hypothetical protein